MDTTMTSRSVLRRARPHAGILNRFLRRMADILHAALKRNDTNPHGLSNAMSARLYL